jgi:hypothetical protein
MKTGLITPILLKIFLYGILSLLVVKFIQISYVHKSEIKQIVELKIENPWLPSRYAGWRLK